MRRKPSGGPPQLRDRGLRSQVSDTGHTWSYLKRVARANDVSRATMSFHLLLRRMHAQSTAVDVSHVEHLSCEATDQNLLKQQVVGALLSLLLRLAVCTSCDV